MGVSHQLHLEAPDELLWNNTDFVETLPGMFVVGDNGGGALYYFDPGNRLGRGAYAMFLVDLSQIGFPYSKHVANGLEHLFEVILTNVQLWDCPYLDSMVEA